MAAGMTELEPRTIEHLRAELAEALAASLAFPPFYDYRSGRAHTRPIDRASRERISTFLNSVNFAPIERVSPSAPDLRRFLERLLLRYLEVSAPPVGALAARHSPQLRALAPRVAADVQRRLVAYTAGGEPGFGKPRQMLSWAKVSTNSRPRSADERDRSDRLLEAALTRSALEAPPSGGRTGRHVPGAQSAPSAPADPWRGLPNDVTIPVPTTSWDGSGPGSSPFAAFAEGAPRAPKPSGGLADQPTGPMASVTAAEPPPGRLQELPQDLYQLYGDYLSDQEAPSPRPTPQTPSHRPPLAMPAGPRPQPARSPAAAPMSEQGQTDGDARTDQLVFWQLRYQLEAYVRRAARSYGVRVPDGDPATTLDALRQSGFVDEADLRIAEGVFALADRVTAQGHATTHDYRQAFMLYLLYHRSHLNM